MLVKPLLMVVGLVGLAGSPSPITLQVTPEVALAPATIRARVTIEPDARNRLAWLAIASDAYSAQREWSLDGTDAPKTTWVEWRDLPGGEYMAAAAVFDRDHERGRATTTFRIVDERVKQRRP